MVPGEHDGRAEARSGADGCSLGTRPSRKRPRQRGRTPHAHGSPSAPTGRRSIRDTRNRLGGAPGPARPRPALPTPDRTRPHPTARAQHPRERNQRRRHTRPNIHVTGSTGSGESRPPTEPRRRRRHLGGRAKGRGPRPRHAWAAPPPPSAAPSPPSGAIEGWGEAARLEEREERDRAARLEEREEREELQPCVPRCEFVLGLAHRDGVFRSPRPQPPGTVGQFT